MDIEFTAQVIENTAKGLQDSAIALNRIAKMMREKQDISYINGALSEMVGILPGLRLDLFVVKPLKEYERITAGMQNEKQRD